MTVDDVDQGAPFSAEDAADVAGSVYTGRENLEVMKHAYQYNRLLLKWISSYAAGASQIVDFGAGAGSKSGSIRIIVRRAAADARPRIDSDST